MKQSILIFGGIAAGILLLFQLSKYSLVHRPMNAEIYLGIAALSFALLGFVLSRLFLKSSSKTKLAPAQDPDQKQLGKTGLSKREYEILVLMARGYSNLEIGQELYISENTVKTHVSNILRKLDAKRRTQAVQIARDLNLIMT